MLKFLTGSATKPRVMLREVSGFRSEFDEIMAGIDTRQPELKAVVESATSLALPFFKISRMAVAVSQRLGSICELKKPVKPTLPRVSGILGARKPPATVPRNINC